MIRDAVPAGPAGAASGVSSDRAQAVAGDGQLFAGRDHQHGDRRGVGRNLPRMVGGLRVSVFIDLYLRLMGLRG